MKINKEKLNTNLKWWLMITIVISWYLFITKTIKLGEDYFHQPVKEIHITKQAKAQISLPEDEPKEMKAWIKWRINQTDINWKDFDCMVKHESNYNQYAINKNTNGTYDIGYLQINEIHRLPREVSFDYKKATEWAINKIKRDGNMLAWYGYSNHCR